MILGDFLFIVLNMGLGVLLAAMFIAHNVYLPMIQSGAEPVGCIELDSDTTDINEKLQEMDDAFYDSLSQFEHCSESSSSSSSSSGGRGGSAGGGGGGSSADSASSSSGEIGRAHV